MDLSFVSANWISLVQAAAGIGVTAVFMRLWFRVEKLWDRVEWVEATGADASDLAATQQTVSALCEAVNAMDQVQRRHEQMLAHMAKMREIKARKAAAKNGNAKVAKVA
jgi:hypothetical protein